MLIDVFAGSDLGSANNLGAFHFARSPQPGEQVEIEAAVFIVGRAWHRPSIYFPGPKFAILVQDEIERDQYSGHPDSFRTEPQQRAKSASLVKAGLLGLD